MKQKIKGLVNEIALNTYKKFFPSGFPVGWDIASDIQRIMKRQPILKIFDVGANRGQVSLYFQKNFSQAQIFAFEPVKNTFLKLEENTKDFNKIKCFQLAFGNTNESKTIFLNNNSEKNSLVDSLQNQMDNKNNAEKILLRKLDDFCEEEKVDYIDILKMDTEGFELEVLNGACNLLENRKISFIISEAGFSPADNRHTFFSNLFEKLYKQGFRVYGFYDLSHWLPYWYEGLIYCNVLFVNAKNIKRKLDL